MNLREAKELTGGGLGYPSKMPGTSYGISAHACITGSKLASVPGSVCHGCYALRNNYNYSSVKTAHANRLASIANKEWTAAFAFLLQREYNVACREYTDLIQKHAKRAFAIKQSLSKPTGSRSRIVGVGSGLARPIRMGTATIQRPEVLNPAMYPLTLPVSGAIVAISPKDMNRTISADLGHALIQTICNYLARPRTNVYMQTSEETHLPAGLHLSYFFRFHDSGDLQSTEHLTKIAAVAALSPNVQFWLPTRELGIVQAYVAKGGIVPDNLTIRVSATMVDGPATSKWPTTSGVFTTSAPAGARKCPAPQQDNKCGKCRSCWSKDVAHITYHKH